MLDNEVGPGQDTPRASTTTGETMDLSSSICAVIYWFRLLVRGPILAAKKQIAGVALGNVMEVLATDSGTLKDIPAWCKKMGHEFLGSFDEAGSIHLFLRKAK